MSELLYVLWRRRLLVAGTVLVMVVLTVLFGLIREPVYTAEATVNIVAREQLSSNEGRGDLLRRVMSSVVTGWMLREVVRRSGWDAGVAEFRERLEVQPIVTRKGGSELQVRFSGSRAEQAARAANAYAEVFVEQVERLNDERLAGGALAVDASVERRAAPPEGARLLLLLVYAAVAAVVGLLVGGVGALLLEGRTRSWRDARDAELTLRAPVLGVIPDYSSTEMD
jgi:uncharacterized protein involved in exopolysaccharide biosynthesis